MVGVINDKIQYIGPETSFKAATSIDAKGKAISPGFINMLSWGYNSLLEDGRGLSDLKQGLPLKFLEREHLLGQESTPRRVIL